MLVFESNPAGVKLFCSNNFTGETSHDGENA